MRVVQQIPTGKLILHTLRFVRRIRSQEEIAAHRFLRRVIDGAFHANLPFRPREKRCRNPVLVIGYARALPFGISHGHLLADVQRGTQFEGEAAEGLRCHFQTGINGVQMPVLQFVFMQKRVVASPERNLCADGGPAPIEGMGGKEAALVGVGIAAVSRGRAEIDIVEQMILENHLIVPVHP